MWKWAVVAWVFCSVPGPLVYAFVPVTSGTSLVGATKCRGGKPCLTTALKSHALIASNTVEGKSSLPPQIVFTPKKKTIKELRAEGGLLTINTPIGALNPFALYYGVISLILGIPWFVSVKTCQLMYWITRGKFDRKVC